MKEVVSVSAVRTPAGSFNRSLALFNASRGLAPLCIGGGQSVVTIIEIL